MKEENIESVFDSIKRIKKEKRLSDINKYQSGGKLTSGDIADIRETEDLKELRRQLKMPIDLKVRNYADNTSTVHTMNRPKSDVELRSISRDTQAKKVANNDIILKNKQTVLARKERIANASKGGSENSIGGSTALGEKTRIFKDDPNSFVDDYLNPAVAMGGMIDSFNDTWFNKYTGPSTIGEKALTAGMLGLSLYGAKTVKGLANNTFNPVAGLDELAIKKLKDYKPKISVTSKQPIKAVNTFKKPNITTSTVLKESKELQDDLGFTTKLKEKEDISSMKQHLSSIVDDTPDLEKNIREMREYGVTDPKEMKLLLLKRKYIDNISSDVVPKGSKIDPFFIENSNAFHESEGLKSLTDNKHKLAQDLYTLGYDSDINKRTSGLRKSNSYKQAIDEISDDLEAAIKTNKLKNSRTFYRGVEDYDVDVIRNSEKMRIPISEAQIGDVYEPGSFMSTSLNNHNFFYTGSDVKMDIKAPGGGKQSILHPNSTMSRSNVPMEEEVILPRKLKYKMVGSKESTSGNAKVNSIWEILNPYLYPTVGVGALINNEKNKK